mmetsp:Transcript_34128/g.77297  ORF Transcript_34128/g.77297 Transcript_34128/m.77297 type:complete len:724 (-) Transcript_34128:38-2209(-)
MGDRSVSPTTAIWNGRRAAREKQASMMAMGLHIFNADIMAGTKGRTFSTSWRDIKLQIWGQPDQTLSFPVQVCTQVGDVRNAISSQLGVEPDDLKFIVKRGCSVRVQNDIDEIGSDVKVRGITSFKHQAYRWDHPTIVMGSGYHGLKTCMIYKQSGNDDFICFDRHDRVGGYCWITAANKTSRLQTELGSFHVWWGPEFVQENNGFPDADRWGIWPHKKEILEHFQFAAETYGVLPNIRFRSSIDQIQLMNGRPKDLHMYYDISVVKLDSKEEEREVVQGSVMFNFPGSMTRNRIVEYPGEDAFDGHIGYGMNDDIGYDDLPGSVSAILGNGAFAIENLRTCVENGAQMVYLITRRKNLASPRMPCWFVHQSPIPVPGWLVLKMFKPMYSLCGFGDPFDYHAVHLAKNLEKVQITQNSRFGIGDVTFLACLWGRAEYVEDTVKRMTKRTLHLTGGRKLEDVTNVVKALGLLGDFAFDRLHNMKRMVGCYCDGDWRRVCMIDDPGMYAANFITFSTGIGTWSWVRSQKYLFDHPQDYFKMCQAGFMSQLPVNEADEKLDKPAYVRNVQYSSSVGMITSALNPKVDEVNAYSGEYKYHMYHQSHSTDRTLRDAIASWDAYQAKWKQEGFSHDYVPYPYSREKVEEWCMEMGRMTSVYLNPDGPTDEYQRERLIRENAQEFGKTPDWAADEGAVDQAEKLMKEDHDNYWKNLNKHLQSKAFTMSGN